jgi:hypothetical protein
MQNYEFKIYYVMNLKQNNPDLKKSGRKQQGQKGIFIGCYCLLVLVYLVF